MRFKKGQVLRLNAKISLSNRPSYGGGTVPVLPGEGILLLEDFDSYTPMKDYQCFMWPVVFNGAVKWLFWYMYFQPDEQFDKIATLTRMAEEIEDVFTVCVQ